MLKRLGWLIGLSQRSRQTKALDAHPYVATRVVKPVLMVDTVQEIAVYIHRFHNLDLFQQGWYQIKISMRWEDGDNNKSCGIPSRVVQYEALDSSSNDSSGVWKIDDKDNSFLTQPFRIKYARQDVRLCMMVSFTMPLQRYEGPATSAVILRFELLYSPIVENISLAHSDDSPASVHDFRIPPKALSGVHSYCPVHFDTFHAVLIDVSVHVSVMKSASYKRPAVLSSDASSGKSLSSGNSQSSKKVYLGSFVLSALPLILFSSISRVSLILKHRHTHPKVVTRVIQRSRQTKTLDAHPYVATRVVKPVLMVDTVQEIAVYIHRFHNLDLFQQGWYQIKISMRWEDGDNNKSCGIPSRVVQYEAPDSSSNDSSGVWKIDDKDNSFLTQPFRIKYARQDVRLCMMVSFTMPLQRYEGPATSAVILRFELLYSPIVENISLAHSDDSPASVHDFRIPPKALSGVHSYCPVHFDTFHAVLIDVSVHVSVMKSASYKRPAVLSSDASSGKSLSSGNSQSSKKAFAQIAPADKLVSFVKALLGARDTLLEEMQKLSKAIDQTIDLSEFVSTMDKTLLSDAASTEKTVDVEGSGQGKQQNNLELKTSLDLESDDWLHNFSKEHLSRTFHLLGTQLHYLWNTFLTFHRDNNTKILEYLRDTWTKDRRAEWSIWMVYSKVEMPHHFISGVDDTSNHSSHKRVTSALKLNDPAQVAATRAELHRRSIAQMRINNRTVQDMHIFGDPMRVPIVIIERVWNAPRRTFSENSYMRHVDKIDSSLLNGHDDESGTRKHNNSQHGGRELKIVVFGHHLDLRLIRNQWLLIDPKIECLMSEANEDKTHGDFREMGQRLAQEVVSFFKRKMDKHSRYGRLKKVKLSFVGHSIGNVIIRTALAVMRVVVKVYPAAFAQIAPADKLVSFVKALLGARDTLLEEMQKLSKAIDQTIDLSEFVSTMDKTLLSDSTEKTVDEGKQQNNLELHASLDLESDDWLHNFSKEHLSRTFHLLGTQLHYLWNTFLTFHRDNNTKILEYLRDTWTKDRRAEWSIWMVYSKVEMPHHFISGVDDVSNHSSHKRVTSALKLNDPAQVAATRAELHRRSIAQMRINNRAVQDMHIFGDPMRVPIVIIERVWNAPRRTFSENSYMRHVDKIDSSLLNGHDDESGTRKHNNSQHGGRELKIVVFVHGFQASTILNF
ncbi:hypothetical protein F2Q69_00063630 [Brassica cretica]|uniref:DUF676 domain-containing protein n=1 Tax=Brassica cretica TaxID=69181 RepID=A0A8S9RF13_BRACR|nr:hypothetical protein F2Q69_00063630 [Brassica cretica]